MFGKPPGRSRGFTAGRSPIFRSAEKPNSRVVELTPATPRADVAWRHLWFIKNKTVADKYSGRFSWNGFVG
jgi:hypothetical protein